MISILRKSLTSIITSLPNDVNSSMVYCNAAFKSKLLHHKAHLSLESFILKLIWDCLAVLLYVVTELSVH